MSTARTEEMLAMGRYRDLVSVLLFAAMFSPVAARLVGWTVYTPLDVPLTAHIVVLVSLAVLGLVGMWNGGRTPTVRHLAEWIAVVVLGSCAALVLQRRANSFYTVTALMDGMALLLAAHLAMRALRWCALRYGVASALRVTVWMPSFWPRRSHDARATRRVASLPSVRFADLLTIAIACLLLLAWLSIALEHRHVAAGLLIVAGALQAMASVVLIPDAMAGLGWLSTERRERRSLSQRE
jgi:hypothetical protein